MGFLLNDQTIKGHAFKDLFFSLLIVAVVTTCVLPPCCFHGDQNVFCCFPSSFSVIQTPLPLPVDKVSRQMCADPLCCVQVVVSVLDLYACCPVSECLCVSGSCHTRVVFAHSNTQIHAHEWSSQLIEECRDCCQFLLQHHHTSPCCG